MMCKKQLTERNCTIK